jgi:hypothetical protein
MTTKAHTYSDTQEHLFYALVSLAFILVCTYVFFLQSLLVSGIATHTLEESSSALETELGQLEMEYLALKSMVITRAHGHTLGFQEPSRISYIYETEDVRYASLVNTGR